MSWSAIDEVSRIKGEVACELNWVDVCVATAVTNRDSRRRRSLRGWRRIWVGGVSRARRGRLRVGVARRRRSLGRLRGRCRPRCRSHPCPVNLLLHRRRTAAVRHRGRLRPLRSPGTLRRRRRWPKEVVAHLGQRSEKVDARRRRRTVGGWRNDAWNCGIDAAEIEIETATVHVWRICQTHRHAKTSASSTAQSPIHRESASLPFRGVHPTDSHDATSPFLSSSPPSLSAPLSFLKAVSGVSSSGKLELKMLVGDF